MARASAPAATTQTASGSTIVYITATGECYHRVRLPLPVEELHPHRAGKGQGGRLPALQCVQAAAVTPVSQLSPSA